MRRIILFVAVLFMTVPALAVSNVDITCTVDGNCVTVSYASDANLVRAFGLDITITTADANITKVVPVDANYRIYPGQIVIVDGNITDYNTPYAPGDLGDANVTVETGSLYTTDGNYASDPNAGYNMLPGLSGTLLKFYVDGDCNYAVTENAVRGGVVMEDPAEIPNVTLCSGTVALECMKDTHPDYANWVLHGKPDCWCYRKQCRGDIDGLQEGPFWVGQNDKDIFTQYLNLFPDFPPPDPFAGVCADLNHVQEGPFWVGQNDKDIFTTWLNSFAPPPDCDGTHINFWIEP